MSIERISVSDAAEELGMRKQTAFKILKRLGVTPTKAKSEQHRGQTVSFITQREFESLADNYFPSREEGGDVTTSAAGVFYLIEVVPENGARVLLMKRAG